MREGGELSGRSLLSTLHLVVTKPSQQESETRHSLVRSSELLCEAMQPKRVQFSIIQYHVECQAIRNGSR